MGRESGRLSNSGCSDSVRDWMQTHVALSADLLVAVVRLGEESERRLNDTTTKSKFGEKASSAPHSRGATSCYPLSSFYDPLSARWPPITSNSNPLTIQSPPVSR